MSVRRTFTHEALLCGEGDDYIKLVGSVIRSGLDDDGFVLFTAPPDRLDPVRADLGVDADVVTFRDITHMRNPTGRLAHVIPLLDRLRGRKVTLVGQPIWPGCSEAERATVMQSESLANLALSTYDVAVVCVYDVAALPARTRADVERTHPIVTMGGARRRSREFVDPATWAPTCLRPWPAAPRSARTWRLDATVVRRVRHEVVEVAVANGLPAERIGDLQLAVHEVVTNAVLHGAGTRELRVWKQPDRLVCEVFDEGCFSDPLAGRRPAPADGEHGRGLLMVNELCDLVQIDAAREGTTVRLHFELP